MHAIDICVLSGALKLLAKFIRSNTIITPNKYRNRLIAAVVTETIEIVKD